MEEGEEFSTLFERDFEKKEKGFSLVMYFR